MGLRKISERIYILPPSAETDRPVLGYIKGDKYSVMVDAGNSSEHVALFQDEIKKLGLSDPDFVVLTHWHWDHTFGACAVKGKVIACQETNNQLETVKKWEWSDDAMAKRLLTGEDIEFCDRCIRLEYPDRNKIQIRTADIIFQNNLLLDLGGVQCQLEKIEGTHSDDCISIYIPEEKVLFIGDADCEDHYHNNGKYEKTRLMKLIHYLEGVDFVTYVLGHDEPQTKEEVLNYLRGESDKLLCDQ